MDITKLTEEFIRNGGSIKKLPTIPLETVIKERQFKGMKTNFIRKTIRQRAIQENNIKKSRVLTNSK